MAMSAAQGGGMFPTNRRKPVLRTFLSLYRGEFVFQGMVDFAVIGALVLLFLHPPSGGQMRSLLGSIGIGGGGSPQGGAGTGPAQQSAQSGPAQSATPGQGLSSTTQAPSGGSTAPVQRTQPAASSLPAKPIVFPAEIAKPALANVMLVEIGDTAFRNSHAGDQQRLLAARTAFRSRRQTEIVDLLKDADEHDPNVAFMRGLGLFARGDEASVKAAEASLQNAAAANHTLAKVLLGRSLITAPRGMTKNVAEGRRLIESAAATGDPQALRVAGIAYNSAEFGSFDPAKAAASFKRAAEAGDPQAMFHYARVLAEGIGAPVDHAGAVDFLGRAAAAGLTSAQFTLGSWLLDQYADGALTDPSEGVSWLDRAIDKGFSLVALNKLQNLYGWTGRLAPWNDKSRFFALAKQCSGLAEAYCQNSIAIAHQFGWGTEVNVLRAYTHKLIARDLGHAGVGASDIDALGLKLTSKERADAAEQARTLRQKLKPAPAVVVFQYPEVVRPPPWATIDEIEKGTQPQQAQPSQEQGATPGAIPFYDYMAKPTGFYYWTIAFDPRSFSDRPPQLAAALSAALAAYRTRQPTAMLEALQNADPNDRAVNLLKGLATLPLSGDAPDPQVRRQLQAEAYRYLTAAANAGDMRAAAILGDLLTRNWPGIPKDLAQARDFAERAGRSNDGFAVRQLAIGVQIGSFETANSARAADLMWTAAELDDPVANAMVAANFQNGVGVPRDPDKAEKYLRRAADLGLTDAQAILGGWIIDRYSNKQLASPGEGVRTLEKAYNAGGSLWAAWRLAVLYDYEGREPPWRDRAKALEYVRKCAPYSYAACHFSLGVIYRNLGDSVRSWAHYDVARGLGSDGVAERLDGIEKLLSSSELDRARNLSQAIKRDLKPMPNAIVIQDAAASRPAAVLTPPTTPVSATNYADELTDWGVQPQTSLKYEVGSRTPTTLPGARRITTQDLQEIGKQALILDVLDERSGHYTIPGAIHLPGGGDYGGGHFEDRIQEKLKGVLSNLVNRNPGRPIVFLCASSKCWESYNAALRAMKMGFQNVLWYRGGLLSWKAASLPLTPPAEVYAIQ
jgi:PQQ-dependent catabolism-associated CXXCW motif protein